MDHQIPAKANKVLNVIILGMLLILIRVWYLSVIQHDDHLQQARKPQRRSIIERAERATVRDRFNVPLALNKIQYNAAVCYADIRQIPSVKWEKDEDGRPKKVLARSLYIKKLSQVLGKELGIEAQQVEDTIHGKASLFPLTPFVIKEDLSEEQYYRLKLLERDWVGIQTERGSTRYYPQGKVGSDVIGYMGSISSKEYVNIAQEMKLLQSYVLQREAGEMPHLPKGFYNPLEVRERLKQLQEKAYTINDLVGKTGIESSFDEELRGYFGKTTYEVDIKGNFLRELPGSRKMVSGQRVLLSISAELQEFAEQLLAQNEQIREGRSADGQPSLTVPWIKGGAIVVVDPNNGEVLTLASYPRFNPNDFIPSHSPEIKKERQKAISQWLENETYVGELWDGKRPLERERYQKSAQSFFNEQLELSWTHYLESILPENSAIAQAMRRVETIKAAYQLQTEIDLLLALSNQESVPALLHALYPKEEGHKPSRLGSSFEPISFNPPIAQRKALDTILSSVPHNDDKLLVLDLCRMIVDKETFSEDLIDKVGQQSLTDYRQLSQASTTVQSFLASHIKEWFHQLDFQIWRDSSFKDYLKDKRKEEKQKKQYTRPYTEYLDQLEKTAFKEFWDRHRFVFLETFILGHSEAEGFDLPELKPYLSKIISLRESPLESRIVSRVHNLKAHLESLLNFSIPYLKTIRSFEELKRPLLGKYRSLRNTQGVQLEKHLAAAFYPLAGFGYGRSQAFRQSTPLGSIFKLIPAYQALLERYEYLSRSNLSLQDVNPLTLVEQLQWTAKPGSNAQILGYTLDGKPITRLYKGGRLPRSRPNTGKIDIRGALEQSSNLYFAMLAADCIENPNQLVKTSQLLGFGERTGIEIPGEIKGALPNDLEENRTGLYAFTMGQHSLVVTPLQSAMMLAAIGNKGKLLKPQLVQVIAGNEPSYDYQDPFDASSFAFQEDLNLIGISFPLFSSMQNVQESPYVWHSSPEIKRTIFLPNEIRNPLIEGMRRVISGERGTARPNFIRLLHNNPQMKNDFLDLKNQIIGKTGTAEISYKPTIDAGSEAYIQNHIWFSGMSFLPSEEGHVSFEEPELVVVVYLRFSEAGGKEAAPLAAAIVKKWREICAKYGRSSYVTPLETESAIP